MAAKLKEVVNEKDFDKRGSLIKESTELMLLFGSILKKSESPKETV